MSVEDVVFEIVEEDFEDRIGVLLFFDWIFWFVWLSYDKWVLYLECI